MVKFVVLAGGSSPSLFPVSRDSLPKQFKKLGKHHVFVSMEEERNERSSFQSVVSLLSRIPDSEIIVVTKKKYRFVVNAQLEEIGLRPTVLFDEDLGIRDYRDAMDKVLEHYAGERLVFVPSDHIIEDEKKFVNTLRKALDFGGNVTIATPLVETSATTGFVRIENNIVVEYSRGLPPDADPNEWHRHTGIVIANRPGIKIEGMYAVVGLYGWHELNSYSELEKHATMDDVSIIRSKDSYVYSETNKKYVLMGLEDIGVIDVGDVVVVYNKKDSSSGKEVIKYFQDDEEIVKFGPTVYKPWGRFTNIHNGERFKIKLLEILPGASISLQKHFHRSEHWIVVGGTAEVTVGNETRILTPGESTFVPIGVAHKVYNPGKKTLKIVEVQFGEYLGDDDIVRLDDPYKRTENEKLL